MKIKHVVKKVKENTDDSTNLDILEIFDDKNVWKNLKYFFDIQKLNLLKNYWIWIKKILKKGDLSLN